MSDVSKTNELTAALRERAVSDSPAHELMKEAADALEAVTGVRVDMLSAVGVESQLALAARQPTEDDRESLLGIVRDHFREVVVVDVVEAILADGFSRAAVPDAATEGTGWSNEDADAAFEEADNRFGEWRGGERHEYADGCYNGFKLGAEWQKARETFISYKVIADEARAERDAALAAVERVRADASSVLLAETDPLNDWNRALDYLAKRILAALDGAPEPEWAYRWGDRNHHAFLDESRHEVFDSHIEAKVAMNRESDRHEDRVFRRRKAGPWLPVEGEGK